MTKNTKQEIIKKVGNKIAKSIMPECEINWNPDKNYRGFTWDGQTLNCSERDPIYGVHDVVHMMFASKRRLKMPEFGLGDDPAGCYHEEECHMAVSPSYAQTEEEKVCNFQICLILYYLGPKEARMIADHLSVYNPPPVHTIKSYKKFDFLPTDFVSKVLEMRKDPWK